MKEIIWRKRHDYWYGTIGEKSFWWGRIEEKDGRFYSEIGHKTFSEGNIIRDSMTHNTLKKAKASVEKRLIAINISGDSY